MTPIYDTEFPAMTLERLLKLPPLESGDALSEPLRERLTRAEFERRYNAMPQVKKAELIEGIVYVSSPVRVIHSQSHAALMTWLGIYRAATPGVGASDNPTVRLDADNEPQPDAVQLAVSRFVASSQAAPS